MADQTPTGLPKPDWFPEEPYSFYAVTHHLDLIVESMPTGYVYERALNNGSKGSCSYWHPQEKQPGCIIGRLLARLGAPAEFLAACDRGTHGTGLDVLINKGMLAGLFDRRAAWALRHIQALQDSGVPWVTAVAQGRSFYGGIRAAERYLALHLPIAQLPREP